MYSVVFWSDNSTENLDGYYFTSLSTSFEQCWPLGSARLLIMSSPYKWLRRPWRWPLELLLISVLTSESAAQRSNSSSNSCYYPSGIISPGKPCHPNANNSVCCGPGFECLGNGICQTSPLIDTPYKHTLYRSACTDPTFQDPACPHFCVGGEWKISWEKVSIWLTPMDSGGQSPGRTGNASLLSRTRNVLL